MGKLLNKKGQTPAGVVLTVVILFGIAIAGLITSYIVGLTTDKLIAVPEINKTAEAVTALQTADSLSDKWDWIILFAFIGTSIGLVLLGYFIDVNTIFLPFYIIALIIGVLLSGVLSYVWNTIFANDVFVDVISQFAITNHLMSNLMIYFSIVGVLAMISTYAKVRTQDGF